MPTTGQSAPSAIRSAVVARFRRRSSTGSMPIAAASSSMTCSMAKLAWGPPGPRYEPVPTRFVSTPKARMSRPCQRYGPVSSTARCGQSGQQSMSASAAAFDGPLKKSSRARLSACPSASVNCRGPAGMDQVGFSPV